MMNLETKTEAKLTKIAKLKGWICGMKWVGPLFIIMGLVAIALDLPDWSFKSTLFNITFLVVGILWIVRDFKKLSEKASGVIGMIILLLTFFTFLNFLMS